MGQDLTRGWDKTTGLAPLPTAGLLLLCWDLARGVARSHQLSAEFTGATSQGVSHEAGKSLWRFVAEEERNLFDGSRRLSAEEGARFFGEQLRLEFAKGLPGESVERSRKGVAFDFDDLGQRKEPDARILGEGRNRVIEERV